MPLLQQLSRCKIAVILLILIVAADSSIAAVVDLQEDNFFSQIAQGDWLVELFGSISLAFCELKLELLVFVLFLFCFGFFFRTISSAQ
jgi:hypothetical protein